MSEEIKEELMDMELDFDKLEQVSGGYLQDLITRIKSSGKAPEYLEMHID